MARLGMATLIAELRGMTDTAADQYSVGGQSYWSDDHLQAKLDQTQKIVWDVSLLKTQHYENGVAKYTRYYIPIEVGTWLEGSETTGAFEVVNSLGNTAPVYTATPEVGLIVFNADTGGTEYFLRARSYDLRAAAAQIWLDKAGHSTKLIEWKAGGHTLKENLEHDHCMKMYEVYSYYQGLGTTQLRKSGYSWQV